MTTNHAPTFCGGSIETRTLVAGRAGERVPCPFCGKVVLLRAPFNAAANGYYVQIPRHHKGQA